MAERRKERYLLRRVQDACAICRRMVERQEADESDEATPPSSVTHRLRNGRWYQNHLLAKIASGEIQLVAARFGTRSRVPSYPRFLVGDNDCCIMRVPEGRTEWRQVQIGGGERNFTVDDFSFGFPLDQGTGGIVYRKDRILPFCCLNNTSCYSDNRGPCYSCWERELPLPTHLFPEWNIEIEQNGAEVLTEGPRALDIMYGTNIVRRHVHAVLRDKLDTLRDLRNDFPVPQYQNIIDPNIGAFDRTWIPTEFEISEVTTPTDEQLLTVEVLCHSTTNGKYLPPGVAHSIASFAGEVPVQGKAKICSTIPDLDPHSHAALYAAIEQVFEAAVPLLARMKHPSLLLPGPLQAVVKAQRIYVAEKATYAGVWHEDGMNENVVAIVLYYFRASECLEGGNMEIASKQTSVIGFGDWGGNPTPEEYLEQLPRAKVPIKEGTMLVFSNYAAVHRVLPMKCKPGGQVGYRDFLAFFVIDQRLPLPLPKEIGSRRERKDRRYDLLKAQLTPRGKFGMSRDDVFSTGNGTPYDLGWIRGQDDARYYDDREPVVRLVRAMNEPPLEPGRGVSDQLHGQLEDDTYDEIIANKDNPLSDWLKHKVTDHGITRAVYASVETFELTKTPPNEGFYDVELFNSTEEWLAHVQEHGYFWNVVENDD